MRDTSGDEEDNRDETLIPVDFRSSGMIKDDDLLEKVNENGRLTRPWGHQPVDRNCRVDLVG